MKSPEFEQQSNITIEQVDFSQPESLKKFAEIGDEWPDYTEDIKKLANIGRAISFVAESGSETAGIATLMLDGWEKDQIVLDNFPGLPELNGLQIKEEFRGQGIGTELTEKLEDKARELGIETVGLGVEIENEGAIRLYKKLGFEIRQIAGQDYFETHWTEKNEDGEAFEYSARCYLMLKDLKS